jgi:hypothetical protein
MQVHLPERERAKLELDRALFKSRARRGTIERGEASGLSIGRIAQGCDRS